MSPATSPAKTTQARLQAVINQSRQIMRKDAGLNGELDRLPQLAWLLFLKAFDDLEEEREAASLPTFLVEDAETAQAILDDPNYPGDWNPPTMEEDFKALWGV